MSVFVFVFVSVTVFVSVSVDPWDMLNSEQPLFSCVSSKASKKSSKLDICFPNSVRVINCNYICQMLMLILGTC